MAKNKKARATAAASQLDAVTDYRFPEATRKNNPPAKIAAEGYVPLIPKAEYLYSPRRPPELRFGQIGREGEHVGGATGRRDRRDIAAGIIDNGQDPVVRLLPQR